MPRPSSTPTDLEREGTRDAAAALNRLLADTFALYLKTKNFHWHMSGPHFRDYHLHSIGEIARLQRVADNDAEYVEPLDMLAELREDNQALAERMREAHEVCDEARDVASASLLEVGIDEAERRTWFLFEASRREGAGGTESALQ